LSKETQKLLQEKMVLAFLAGLQFARTRKAVMTDEGFITKEKA